jgi:acetylornithine deacetylase/succinyl-diaminopimelate desuccinylase-like protein
MTTDPRRSARQALAGLLGARRDRLAELCAGLVRTPSENPPGDTRAVAGLAAGLLRRLPGAEVEEVAADPAVVNVVARVRGHAPGRRLVFSGHLDTFPAGDAAAWTVEPFGGVARDGRLYGRGVSDMKGGIACSLLAAELLAACPEAWRGELVVALAGDEETMGTLGTAHLLDTVPHVRGDAMICGDAGSPHVLRFGEKGFLWLEVAAAGKAAHGAHVHLGENAIERLLEATRRLLTLRELRIQAPAAVAAAMREARAASEAISGAGESGTLATITVNCGAIQGGTSPNLVPARAEARFDIRLPVGVTTAEVEAAIAGLLAPLDGVRYHVFRRVEPNWTPPDHEVIRLLQECGREVLGRRPVVNMRVGASDSRLYRARGLAAVVCGPTPHNMGGPDEHVVVDDLAAVAAMHTLAAFDFLSAPAGGAPPGAAGRPGPAADGPDR